LPPIFRHRRPIILFGPPQIQRSSPINRRNTPVPGAETMPQPPEPLPRPISHSFDLFTHANSFTLMSISTFRRSSFR
jgi:hypothetical protein